MSLDSILERIAVALETIAGNAAPAADKPASKPRAAKPASAPAASEPTVVAATATPTAAPVAASTPAVTREQIANGVTALINGGKREAVAAILKEHGASNISTIKPEHYASVHAKLTAAV